MGPADDVGGEDDAALALLLPIVPPLPPLPPSTTGVMAGLSNARGKPVPPSAAAMARARKMLESCGADDTDTSSSAVSLALVGEPSKPHQPQPIVDKISPTLLGAKRAIDEPPADVPEPKRIRCATNDNDNHNDNHNDIDVHHLIEHGADDGESACIITSTPPPSSSPAWLPTRSPSTPTIRALPSTPSTPRASATASTPTPPTRSLTATPTTPVTCTPPLDRAIASTHALKISRPNFSPMAPKPILRRTAGGSCPPPNRRRPLEDDDNAISPRKLKFSAPFNAPKPSKAAIERERLGLPKPSVQASPSSVYKKPSSIFDLNPIAVRVDLRHAGLIPCPLDVALLNAYDVPEQVMYMTKDSARYFEFDDGTNWQVMKTCLLRVGADAKLLTAEWVEHHYGMIVWKLASMERSMPDKCAGRCLTAERVFLQLKYRYEREINKAHRSAIAKIVEKDDVPHRFLVLCVASIRSYGTEGAPEVTAASTSIMRSDRADEQLPQITGALIELTDGWHCINAQLDTVLTEHLAMGRIFVGQKLRIFGAQLDGLPQPTPPLELPPSAMLKLCANGTRRARWDAKLGAQRQLAFSVNIPSIVLSGGVIPAIDVIVVRTYRCLFMEKDADGRTVAVRNEHGEEIASAKHQEYVATMLAKKQQQVQAEVMREFEQEERELERMPKQRLLRQEIDALQFGEEIYVALKRARNTSEFMALLNREQRNALESHQSQLATQQQERVNEELQAYMAEEPSLQRSVTPFLRIKVADCPAFDGVSPNKLGSAIITFWRPTEDMMTTLTEGKRVRILGLTPSTYSSKARNATERGSGNGGSEATSTSSSTERASYTPSQAYGEPRWSQFAAELDDERSMLDIDTEREALYAIDNNREKRLTVNLNALKSTRFQDLGPLPPTVLLPEPVYEPRAIQPIRQLHESVKRNAHFDCCVVFLVECAPVPLAAVGDRAASTMRRIFTVDLSGALLVIEVREYLATKLPSALRPDTVLAITDLSFSRYDASLDVHVAYATDYSYVCTNPMSVSRSGWNPAFLTRAFLQTDAWRKSSPPELARARDAVRLIVEGEAIEVISPPSTATPSQTSVAPADELESQSQSQSQSQDTQQSREFGSDESLIYADELDDHVLSDMMQFEAEILRSRALGLGTDRACS